MTLSRTQYNAFYAQDQLDPRAAHAARRCALRPFLELLSAATARANGVRADRARVRDDNRRDRLQRHHTAPGRGLRPVRERQDRDQVHHGQVLEAAVNGNGNYSGLLPSSRIATSVTRTWSDANHDYNPDCNLQNPLANGECGQISNLNFGKNVYSLSYNPTILQGWGVRPSDWGTYLTLQQQILPRVALTAGYTRRWLQNFTVIDNRSVSASDYTPFSVTAPLDPRLPGGGGYSISGLYDIAPAKFGQTNNLVTYAPNYGNISSIYNGLELNVTARLLNSLSLQAGSSTGETVTDSCAVRAVPARTDPGVRDGQ